jgi:hypothetical protein
MKIPISRQPLGHVYAFGLYYKKISSYNCIYEPGPSIDILSICKEKAWGK